MKRICYHPDGTVSYWSVYEQRWLDHAASVPDRELAAMPSAKRRHVMRHYGVHQAAGRPSLYGSRMVTKSVQMPAELWRVAEQEACAASVSVSEIVRRKMLKA